MTTSTIENGRLQLTSLLEPPTTLIDVTEVLQSTDPMRTYCDLLLNCVNPQTADSNETPVWSRTIWETSLINNKAEKQAAANWNGGRKALYLVAYATG